MTRQASLFEGARLQMTQSIQLTIDSITTYGPTHEHWAIAWSGGKDSTTLLTLVVYLILSGKVPPPKTLTVLYADTRLELLPLWISAQAIRDELEEHREALAALGVVLDIRVVMAPMDKRFLVYLLGRGVPPPNNNTLRWCTRQIKIDPMAAELRRVHAARAEVCGTCGGSGTVVATRDEAARMRAELEADLGPDYEVALHPLGSPCGACGGQGQRLPKILMLTGVRQGESAIRDGRIAMSCGRDGAECGQGWYQETLPEALCDTLAPLLHWRVCHVWEWLRHWAPQPDFGDWSTELLASAYGGDEAEEKNARTGCVGCPLAERDTALDAVVAQPDWSYLAPLKRLRPLWRLLREPALRLRKAGLERRKDGSAAANPQRMGPLVLLARAWALELVLGIQEECNAAARQLGRPLVDILDAEEEARVRQLLAARTWPDGWDGTEPTGDVLLPKVFADGTEQPLLPVFRPASAEVQQ